MSKVAFIGFSDIQIEDWKRHSKDHSRFFINEAVLKRVLYLCIEYKCPALFMGDLFDNARALDNYLLNHIFLWFNRFKEAGVMIFGISGNHDQSESNFIDRQSPSYIKMMASIYTNFIDMDFKTITHNGFTISGIPYITSNVNFKLALEEAKRQGEQGVRGKKHILMIHTDLWGAKDGFGRVVDSVQSIPAQLDKYFKGFDLILSGHIHVPQALRRNILMLGATHQQRTSDMGVNMKVWKIYNDLSYSSISTNQPEFRYDDGKQDSKHFLIPIPEEIKEEDVPITANFKTTDPIKLAKNFLRAKKIKSKPKLNLLIKYLKHAGN